MGGRPNFAPEEVSKMLDGMSSAMNKANGQIIWPEPPIMWTYYKHRAGDDEFIEGVPVFSSVSAAIAGLDTILDMGDRDKRRISFESAIKDSGFSFAHFGPQFAARPVFYRGQANIRYFLRPTEMRTLDFDLSDRARHISGNRERALRGINHLDNIPEMHEYGFIRTFSVDQKRAICRHYGVKNALLDLTTNSAVAAFFAIGADNPVPSLSDDGTEFKIGIIYGLHLWDWMLIPRFSLVTPTTHGFRDSSWHFGEYARGIFEYVDASTQRWTTLRVKLVFNKSTPMNLEIISTPKIYRIERQSAYFLSLGNSHETTVTATDVGHMISMWSAFDFWTRRVAFLQGDPLDEARFGALSSNLLIEDSLEDYFKSASGP
jgi:hypothetical protein